MLEAMARSATLEGFRAVLRHPAIFLAELAWRWAFAGAALGLTAFAGYEYLRSLEVSDRALLLLSTRIPVLVAQAVADILQGSGPRLVRAALLVAIGLSTLWILFASLGRQSTLAALRAQPVGLRPLLGLHFLRLALALAAFLSYLGALLLALHLSDGDAPRPGVFLLSLLLSAAVISFLHGRVRAFLLLAMVFSAERDTFAAVEGAVALFRRHRGAFARVALVFGVTRLALAAFVFFALLFGLGMSADSAALALVFCALVLLAYRVVADFLNLAQLAAWAALADLADEPPTPPPAPVFPPLPLALPPAPLAGS